MRATLKEGLGLTGGSKVSLINVEALYANIAFEVSTVNLF